MFSLFCPANPTIFDQPMMMFHNGSMKDNLNYKTLCPLKQKEHTTRITFQNMLQIYVINRIPGPLGANYDFVMLRQPGDSGQGELLMEEWRGSSIKKALQKVGRASRICFYWEIYKLLFINHNVNAFWIAGVLDEIQMKV